MAACLHEWIGGLSEVCHRCGIDRYGASRARELEAENLALLSDPAAIHALLLALPRCAGCDHAPTATRISSRGSRRVCDSDIHHEQYVDLPYARIVRQLSARVDDAAFPRGERDP